jgi:hypothetical protein
MIERSRRPGKRWGVVIAGVVAAGAIATVIALRLTRSDETKDLIEPATTTPPPGSAATLKLVTEPADTEISIEGQPVHHGAPWSTELAPGIYQVQITRADYKSWLTSLELSPDEKHTLRVVLEKLPPASTTSKSSATLSLSSTPSGLDVVLDGKLLGTKTPILRMELPVGPHAIALRKDGLVVWTHELEASATVDYEYNPSMEPAKLRERDARVPARPTTFRPRTPAPPNVTSPTTPTHAPTTPDAAEERVATTTPPATTPPETTPPGATTPAPATTNPAPAITTTKPTTPAVPATPTTKPGAAPITVPPNRVTKISGATPQLLLANANLPTLAAATLCINAAGQVTDVKLITHLDVRSAADLKSALMKWRYAPYKNQPVCFAITFKLK